MVETDEVQEPVEGPDLGILLDKVDRGSLLSRDETLLLSRYVRTLEDCVARLHPHGSGFGMDVRFRVQGGMFQEVYGEWLSRRGAR